MILDKLLIKNINIIGSNLVKKCALNEYPKNIAEMKTFLDALKSSIENNEFGGALIGNILFSFVSSEEIRDRNSTSRIFEDIFSALFNEKCSDKTKRSNPKSTDEILKLDALCENEDWKISGDLSGNKREKTDLTIGTYNISLKTLKGKNYNLQGHTINTKINRELNIGSLSFRALLKGILTDQEIAQLGDRKSGLGSGPQLRESIFNPIINASKTELFLDRLKLFLNYVYEDDIYLVLKSNYRIDFYLIPNKSFINSLIYTYEKEENKFEKIVYRWENNNLRINWLHMLSAMDRYKQSYYKIFINLGNIQKNQELDKFKNDLSDAINHFINEYI